ncbi:MAG: 3-dehydroquinate synthase [Planctomycetes bacterium]|nr:3-dehydroquinate synthase [Planctomycetota bacterium]
MHELEVKIPSVEARSYRISIGNEILGSLWDRIEADYSRLSKFVVTDENLVSAGHLEAFLGRGSVLTFVISPAGETSKNIDTVTSIIEAMEKAYLGRDTLVVALGGGTVGDIAGFAASVFKRGVPIVHVPTTTVAQADSSIGGKTGVDSSISKNAFGAFWHPAAVYIDVAVLTTLDDRQFRAGLVESVKHALIADNEYFDFLQSNIEAVLERKADVLEKMADYNCKIKAGVVEADPTEKNQRRMLNYGHTVGHAVEAASGFELLHGESVAIGIIAAGLIESEMGLSEPGRLDRIRKIFEKIGVPITLPANLAEDNLVDLIKRDKKAVNKWPRFVLISRIGKVYCRDGQWAVEVEQDVVENVLGKF